METPSQPIFDESRQSLTNVHVNSHLNSRRVIKKPTDQRLFSAPGVGMSGSVGSQSMRNKHYESGVQTGQGSVNNV